MDWLSWHCIFRYALKFHHMGLYSVGIIFLRTPTWALTGLSVV